MVRRNLLAVALLSTAPVGASASNHFADPPPNLLFQLQKQNRARPWLRVTADTSRLDLRVRRIDVQGLNGLQSRTPDSPPPGMIPWSSVARIDEVVTRARRGGVTGFIVGGALGAALGNALGESMRSPTRDSYGNPSTSGNGGMGAVLGLAVFGGLGAWGGSRLGERMVHERPWYVAAPSAAPALVSAPSTIDSSAIATLPPHVLTPSIPDRSPSAPASRLATSRKVLRACERIDRDDLIRMRGDFGHFQGFAAVVGPEGMEGLRVDPHRRDLSAASYPTGLVTWDRIDYVDKRGSGAGKGAWMGAASLGLVGGLFSFGIVSTFGDGDKEDAVGAMFAGGAMTGAVGALLGGLIGSAVPAWHKVYEGP